MEVAKISSKGQITIPVSVRNKLKLRAGDKIVILEENGRFYFENSLQCLHLNVQRMPLQVKHKRLDLKQKKICRSI